MNFIFRYSLLLFCFIANAQTPALLGDPEFKAPETNPVIYTDVCYGGLTSARGEIVNISMNYAFDSNLVTARVGAMSKRRRDNYPFIPYSKFRMEEQIFEYAVMYGRRITGRNASISFSAGISLNDGKKLVREPENLQYDYSQHIGMPFEVSLKLFKKRKIPYHIYCVLPLGPRTGLGHSVGIKLVGNVSSTTFVGVGLTWGWGWHKKYYDY